MDHSRIDRAAVPSHAQPIATEHRDANPASKSRFLRAMEQGTPAKDGNSRRAAPITDQSAGVPLYALFAMSQSHAKVSAPPTNTPARAQEQAELTNLLERACSAMYVGDGASNGKRVVLALDPVLAGAAAEIVRNGSHLSIRLHAQNDTAFRSMSSRREHLIKALGTGCDGDVEVEVVRIDTTPASRPMLVDE